MEGVGEHDHGEQNRPELGEGEDESGREEMAKEDAESLRKAYMRGPAYELEPAFVRPRDRVKVFVCLEGCPKRFSTLRTLKNHNRLKHPEPDAPRYPCPLCPLTFHLPCKATAHFRDVHAPPEEQKPCTYGCEKTFTRQQDLTAHENRVHKRIKPYACVRCNRSFAGRRSAQKCTHT